MNRDFLQNTADYAIAIERADVIAHIEAKRDEARSAGARTLERIYQELILELQRGEHER